MDAISFSKTVFIYVYDTMCKPVFYQKNVTMLRMVSDRKQHIREIIFFKRLNQTKLFIQKSTRKVL